MPPSWVIMLVENMFPFYMKLINHIITKLHHLPLIIYMQRPTKAIEVHYILGCILYLTMLLSLIIRYKKIKRGQKSEYHAQIDLVYKDFYQFITIWITSGSFIISMSISLPV